jgi:hypothetical protein
MKRYLALGLCFAAFGATVGFAAETAVAGQGAVVTNRGNQTYYYAPSGNRQTYYRQPTAQPRRSYSMGPNSGVWPNYPNYGNPVGAAYSKAAGMRQGQWFGTFGLHPADAKARGAY